MRIKRFISAVIIALLCVPSFCTQAAGKISIYVNGSVLESAGQPQIVDDVTLVPLRSIAEAMGAVVIWDDDDHDISVFLNDKMTLFTIDDSVILKGNLELDEEGQPVSVIEGSVTSVTSEIAPQIINGLTYVPLRVIAEALNAEVNWDAETKTVTVETVPEDTEFTLSDNLTYTVENSVLTISGQGAMEDFAETEYYSDEHSSLIPADIKEVVIEDGVTYIGAYAFKGCPLLTKVTLPDSVTEIGAFAFEYCTSLTEINLPEGLTTIGEKAFMNCEALESVTLPESFETAGNNIFCNCFSLKNVALPEGMEKIYRGMFIHCAFESIEIPSTVTEIEDYAFEYCAELKEVTIPDGVTTLGSNSFAYCDALTSVTMPESVTSVYTGAFDKCGSLITVKCVKDSAADNSGLYPVGVTFIYE